MSDNERQIIMDAGWMMTESEGERLLFLLGFQREPENDIRSRFDRETALKEVILLFNAERVKR